MCVCGEGEGGRGEGDRKECITPFVPAFLIMINSNIFKKGVRATGDGEERPDNDNDDDDNRYGHNDHDDD